MTISPSGLTAMNSEPRLRNISFENPEAEAGLYVLYVFVSFHSCHISSRSLTKLHASSWSSRTQTWSIRIVSEAESQTLRIWRTPTWGGMFFVATCLQIVSPKWLQRWEHDQECLAFLIQMFESVLSAVLGLFHWTAQLGRLIVIAYPVLNLFTPFAQVP